MLSKPINSKDLLKLLQNYGIIKWERIFVNMYVWEDIIKSFLLSYHKDWIRKLYLKIMWTFNIFIKIWLNTNFLINNLYQFRLKTKYIIIFI